MKFLMLVRHDKSFNPPDTINAETATWVDGVEAKNARVIGDILCPSNDAALVQVVNDKIIVRSGPLSSEEYQIAGFDVLDVKDIATAIDVVASHPMAKYGLIEIRQFWEEEIGH